MNYCLVEKELVVEGPKILPTNWRNISNLPALPDEELRKLGWVPVEYPVVDFDPVTQKRLADTYNILFDKVKVVFNYKNKTNAEIIAEAEAALKPPVIGDNESVGYIREFLKAKFKDDVLFPEELK
jgi:uncharacterized protein YjeT (DUF2065 family)